MPPPSPQLQCLLLMDDDQRQKPVANDAITLIFKSSALGYQSDLKKGSSQNLQKIKELENLVGNLLERLSE